MIGTTLILGENASKANKIDALKEPWHLYKSVINSEIISLSYTYYDGYPIEQWQYREYLIQIEGAIYNLDVENIKERLNAIIDADFSRQGMLNFIESADGDFCVYFINKTNNRVVVFNDILGGLPIFYSVEGNRVIISRQYGLILANLKEKNWDSQSLAEFLSFSHNLRRRTFSRNIYKVEPASYIDANYNGDISINYSNLYVEDFAVKDRYKSKNEAAAELAKLFLESCKNRVNFAIRNGYKIVNTMSGGFDSRTVMGGVEKFVNQYVNITYQYLQDESSIAKQVLEAVDSKSTYYKFDFKNEPNFYNKIHTCNTDGRINVYTNSICYNDMLSVREKFGAEKVLYFGGFGGEYIRHPKFETIIPFSKIGLNFRPSFYITSKICNVSINSLIQQFKNSFENTKGKREAKFKDFYNEYYQNLVRCSGEDRTRMFYFTVQPMMGKDFIMAIRHKLPLKWVGFSFYKKFLENIDKRLVMVDIFGEQSDYLSDKNLRRLDFRRRNVEYLISLLRLPINRFTKKEYKNKREIIDTNEMNNCIQSIGDSNLFDVDFLKNNFPKFSRQLQYSLFAVLSYLSENK